MHAKLSRFARQKRRDAWATFNSKSLLGELLGQKRYAEAEPLLRAGYAGMKQRIKTIPVISRDRIVQALDRLIELAEATGKAEDAIIWKAEKTKLAGAANSETGGQRKSEEKHEDERASPRRWILTSGLRRTSAPRPRPNTATEPAGHTLDATALVHEAYLRLGGEASADRSAFLSLRGPGHAAHPRRSRSPQAPPSVAASRKGFLSRKMTA